MKSEQVSLRNNAIVFLNLELGELLAPSSGAGVPPTVFHITTPLTTKY
ncbi:MAG: hypothetical protein ABIN97_11025 [Ginsengibacter sp.]